MKILRAELLAALTKVKPALANKEVIEQSTAFAFLGDRVVTFNDEIAISHPLDSGMTGAIQAGELHKLLSKTKDESLEMEIKAGADGSELHLVGKRMKAGIRIQDEIRLPLDSIEAAGDWFVLPEAFIQGLRFVIGAASTDLVRPDLTCVHFGDGFLEACDNFKIARFDMDPAWPVEEQLLIPAASLSVLFPYKPVDISVGNGWAHFRNEEGTVISVRTMAVEYRDLSGFLTVEGVDVDLPKELNEVLGRAGIFAAASLNKESEVELKIEPGWATVRAEGDAGWIEEKTRCKYTGEPFAVRLRPDSLSAILNETQTAVVGEAALAFTGAYFTYVVSLPAGA